MLGRPSGEAEAPDWYPWCSTWPTSGRGLEPPPGDPGTKEYQMTEFMIAKLIVMCVVAFFAGLMGYLYS